MSNWVSFGQLIATKIITRAQQYLRWATMATRDMGRKEGGCCAPRAELSLRSPSNTVWPGPRSSSIQPFGHNYRHGPKIRWREAGSPSKTKSPGPRPTSVPSSILIHPAVWPQRTWAENWGLCPFRGGGSWVPN